MAGLEICMEYSGGRTGMIRALAAAQALAWLITAALLLAMAFVMWKFQPDIGKMQLGIYGIYVLSCLFAGRYTGKRGARRKFLWGMCSGMLYFGILAAVSVLSERTVQPDALHRVLAFVFCAAGGMLGGMTA